MPSLTSCEYCGKPIMASRYLIDVWGNSAHKEHAHTCFCCSRFVKESDVRLPDGRWQCEICRRLEVSSPERVKWVDSHVRILLSKYGVSLPVSNVSVETVTYKKLCSVVSNPSSSMEHSFGVTLTTTSLFGQKHRIFLLDKMHRIKASGVLAHELLHVWQNERHLSLHPKLTEGFCNLGAWLMFKFINQDMSKVLIDEMEQNPDPIYGDGFRLVKSIYKKLSGASLPQLMNELKVIKI